MEQKVRGLLAYLFGWLGGLIILLALKDNSDQTKFNACQAIVISVTRLVVSIVLGFIPFVGMLTPIFGLLMFALSIIGMVKAYKEEDCEFPIISDLTRNIFKSALN